MVGSTGTLMTMRLVRSKLRKREETSSASPATIEAAQTTTYAPQQNGHVNGSAKKQSNGLTTSASDSNVVLSNTGNGNLNNLMNGSSDPSFNSSNQNSVWVFPPLPPQPNIYNCNNNIVSRVLFCFMFTK